MENRKDVWIEVMDRVYEVEKDGEFLVCRDTGNEASDYDQEELADNGFPNPRARADSMGLRAVVLDLDGKPIYGYEDVYEEYKERQLGIPPSCPKCGKNDMVIKNGTKYKADGVHQRYFCKRDRFNFESKWVR